MKKLILFLLVMTIFVPNIITGQSTIPVLSNKWSSSISYAPITTFFYYHPHNEYLDFYSKGIREDIYPLGFNIEITRHLNNRLSVNSGINFKAIFSDNLIIREGWFSDYYEKSTDNEYIFEMPINFKYKILAQSGDFDPYIKAGLRGSYFKRYYVGVFTSSDIEGQTKGDIDKHDGRLLIFGEIGAGTYLNLSKSIAFLIGSNLTFTLSGFGYFEVQTGFKYSF
jgi:hypothetical protein